MSRVSVLGRWGKMEVQRVLLKAGPEELIGETSNFGLQIVFTICRL